MRAKKMKINLENPIFLLTFVSANKKRKYNPKKQEK